MEKINLKKEKYGLIESSEICPRCGKHLVQSVHNNQVDILYCDNWKCGAYRSPAGSIKTERIGMQWHDYDFSRVLSLEEQEKLKEEKNDTRKKDAGRTNN